MQSASATSAGARVFGDADVAAIRAELLETGYVIVRDALAEPVRARIAAAMEPWFGRFHGGRNDFEGFDTERVYALPAKVPEVATEPLLHPLNVALVDSLLPKGWLLWSMQGNRLQPGETPQRLHRDDATSHVPYPRPHPHWGVSSAWALTDFTEHNGATLIVPGSHRWPDGREARPEEVRKLLMPAGSVAYWLGTTLHGGGANDGHSERRTILSLYCAPWVRPQETYTLSIPRETVRTFPLRVQEMLGYGIAGRTTGHVDGMHPRRLLDDDYVPLAHRSPPPADRPV